MGAYTVPVYRGVTMTTDDAGRTTETATTDTLIGQNGTGVLVPVTIPLVATAASVVLLALAGRHRWAEWAAWAPVAVTAALTLLGMLTIGIFIAPVAVALAVATALNHRPTTLPGRPA
ncbi:hypothetical protein [Knoellia koreensis]|uniref:Uncharacterized protein n=1 Tax=Knoellia koreensis TaxID=2730921 RepID=A0A849H9D1_9MICO|nr:hypothetical protein [Knoellia sp. DB2414S]